MSWLMAYDLWFLHGKHLQDYTILYIVMTVYVVAISLFKVDGLSYAWELCQRHFE